MHPSPCRRVINGSGQDGKPAMVRCNAPDRRGNTALGQSDCPSAASCNSGLIGLLLQQSESAPDGGAPPASAFQYPARKPTPLSPLLVYLSALRT
jgi:hypothetical protein